jgi:hypothetical protein
MTSRSLVRVAHSFWDQVVLVGLFATAVLVAIGVPALRAAIEEVRSPTVIERPVIDFSGL